MIYELFKILCVGLEGLSQQALLLSQQGDVTLMMILSRWLIWRFCDDFEQVTDLNFCSGDPLERPNERYFAKTILNLIDLIRQIDDDFAQVTHLNDQTNVILQRQF